MREMLCRLAFVLSVLIAINSASADEGMLEAMRKIYDAGTLADELGK